MKLFINYKTPAERQHPHPQLQLSPVMLRALPAAFAVLAHLVLAILQAHFLDFPRAAVRVLAPRRRSRHVRDRADPAADCLWLLLLLLLVRRLLLLLLLLLLRRVVDEEAPARHAVRLNAQLPRPVRKGCGGRERQQKNESRVATASRGVVCRVR